MVARWGLNAVLPKAAGSSTLRKYLLTHVIFADSGPEDMDDRPPEEERPRGRVQGVAIQRVVQKTALGNAEYRVYGALPRM
jgi:hypothetical protein